MKIEVTQCSMCTHYDTEQYCEVWEQYITNDAFYCACGARADRKTENCSEKPNNCEHITEDGVTCAKYPACDDCLDNPLNKVKGSERLLKGSEKPNNCELQTIRCPKCGRTDYIRDMEKDMGIKGSCYKYKCVNCNTYIKDEPTISKMEQVDKDINVRSKDEPQTERSE